MYPSGVVVMAPANILLERYMRQAQYGPSAYVYQQLIQRNRYFGAYPAAMARTWRYSGIFWKYTFVLPFQAGINEFNYVSEGFTLL
jgi:hypothetical protein